MTHLVAWRLLTYEKGRSALAIAGLFVAVLMIFLQLGFYSSVPAGGMGFYDKLRFDLLLTSSAYYFQGQSFDFPRSRLYQAMALPAVRSAAPVYQDEGQWLNPATGLRRNIFVLAFDLDDHVLDAPDIDRQRALLELQDTVLADRQTKPMFGPMAVGTHAELNNHDVTIVGSYDLGMGFAGLGEVVTSDVNFVRIFPSRRLNTVNMGLVSLKPGSDPARVARELRELLPDDTRVFTRTELANREARHWVSATSTGIVFGFGAVISMVVGTVILYQILTTQIRRQLPQYAVLKAIGYHDRSLAAIVVILALAMAAIAYVPAVGASIVVYRIVRGLTLLPLAMTGARLAGVLLVAAVMSAGSALVSARVLRRADPADLF